MNQHPDLKKKKKLKKKKAQLPIRINILFLSVFLVFSLLIVQLGVVQILNGEEAQRQINQTENTPSEKPVPRGKMYDSDYNLILDNKAIKSITYTPPKNGDTAEERLDLAENLSRFVTIIKDEDELEEAIRERDKKEYWYLKKRDEVAGLLTAEEREKLETGEEYQAELDAITEENLAEFDWTSDLLNVLAIKKELDAAYELSPHVVVNDGLTEAEYAQVAEHLNDLSGIDAVIDWDRERLYEGTLSSFFGNLTSSDEGIPRENSDFYLSNGYTWNDRVGTSGLEEQYEHVLRGRKEKVQYTTNSQGDVINSDVVVEGERGKDLVLSVDMEFQSEVDKIVEEELRTAINNSYNNTGYLEDALAVVMDPQTGDILALSGVRYDEDNDEYLNQAYRTIYDSHEPGSAIKGATLLAGYQEGVVDIGTHMADGTIQIKGTPPFQSHKDLGPSISDVYAIQESSNVYMARIAMEIAGATYRYEEPLYNFDNSAFDTMRNYYSQFGLGVKTGIDLPFEATGVTGADPAEGNLLHLSIGQYDTYTTLQLAQYVSTIANDGYRMKPRLVEEIREAGNGDGTPGKIIESFSPEVLNRVDMDDKYIERVQEGFRRVFTNGTASNPWSNFPYEVAGKTGTAQRTKYKDIDGKPVKVDETENLSLVGYSPAENPEIAFAVIVPENGTNSSRHAVHHAIGKKIIEAYYELKDKSDEEKQEQVENDE
ncbi:Cell division protein FtsI/penicillin-binding protein 2 [Gracilibacillus orientalis]|uniref:serine-type D-Ala-D-Ala carboxypeptidase n=1 Tax=Gracilibacillus orientalis TaxID=334253 RepID=A0A1I4KT42_9BACI|nr:penicillin-binding protein 2 [Gracilibacillus orientalis]SFL81925.1 Cell division protein FtsI/penicillin-binding protein 2 [Gracilibacillus orientalis]